MDYTQMDWVTYTTKQQQALELMAELMLANKSHLTVDPALGYKNDPTVIGGVQPYVHGGGGLLSPAGQDPAIFSAIVQPDRGVLTALPIRNTVLMSDEYGGYDAPLYTTFTGVTAGDLDDWDNQPTAPCDDAPVAGLLKACTLTAPFGRFSAAVRQIDRKRMGRLVNLGETGDFRLQNGMITADPFTPQQTPQNGGDWINQEIAVRYFEAAMGFQRLLAPLVFTGNPINNTAQDGARQFMGLDLLINAGNKRDAFTSAVCTAMDSAIATFGGANVNEADADGNYIYEWFEYIMRYLNSNAERMGMAPASWVAVMRRDLFYELTRYWRIQYYVQFIRMMDTINTAAAGGRINVEANDEAAMRDAMFKGRFLPLATGERLNVILDDGIAVTAVGAESQSEVYFVPLTVLGSVPVTYWQYFNYENAQGRLFDQQLSRGQTYTTDGGKFLWAWSHKNGCFTAQWTTEPRIIMHTPYLAARLQDVNYQPLIAVRDAYPDGGLFYNGGRTNSPFPSYYNEWASTPSWEGPTP